MEPIFIDTRSRRSDKKTNDMTHGMASLAKRRSQGNEFLCVEQGPLDDGTNFGASKVNGARGVSLS
jgi:hypothetical protein